MNEMTQVLGVVAMEPKGDYDASTYYEKLNTVLYNDSTYMAKEGVVGEDPSTSSKWQLIGGGVRREDIVDNLDSNDATKMLSAKQGKVLNEGKTQVFDTVALMKSANLKNGMTAQTLGYYSVNDGGGATYKITNTASLTAHQETLDNSLYATLVIGDSLNIKQVGAYGDGTHDDTLTIKNAIDKYKKIFFPNGTYLTDYIYFKSGCDIDGNLSTINTAVSSTHLNAIGSNCTIKNLTINSTNADREWNRIDLNDSENVKIENCTFSGFRQETIPAGAPGKNVWALYFKNSKNIEVNNCLFDNNNFEDVLIEFGCENIIFNNINSVDDTGVRIDIEPSSNTNLYNIKFNNCIIYYIHTTDYFYTGNNTYGITLNNCKIGEIAYHGSDVTLINCAVDSYRGLLIDDNYFGGPLKLINSATFSDNLIDDPYFDDVANANSSYWKMTYFSTTWYNMVKSVIDNDGIFTAINPDNLGHNAIICTPFINVSASTSYLLRTVLKSHNPSDGNTVSTHARITYYDNTDTEISKHLCSINRHPLDSTSKVTDESVIFNTPANCAKIKIEYRNGPGGAKQSVYLKSCGLYAISTNQYANSNLPSFKERQHREFYKSAKPTTNYINYSVGDKMLYSTPTTYIGAICTNDSTQGGTWTNYGALES